MELNMPGGPTQHLGAASRETDLGDEDNTLEFASSAEAEAAENAEGGSTTSNSQKTSLWPLSRLTLSQRLRQKTWDLVLGGGGERYVVDRRSNRSLTWEQAALTCFLC